MTDKNHYVWLTPSMTGDARGVYPTCCPLVHFSPKGASKMLRATGHARMVSSVYVESFAKLRACQTLPGLPRAARPSGRFAEGKTPQRGVSRYETYFGRNVRQLRAPLSSLRLSRSEGQEEPGNELSDVVRPSASIRSELI